MELRYCLHSGYEHTHLAQVRTHLSFPTRASGHTTQRSFWNSGHSPKPKAAVWQVSALRLFLHHATTTNQAPKTDNSMSSSLLMLNCKISAASSPGKGCLRAPLQRDMDVDGDDRGLKLLEAKTKRTDSTGSVGNFVRASSKQISCTRRQV